MAVRQSVSSLLRPIFAFLLFWGIAETALAQPANSAPKQPTRGLAFGLLAHTAGFGLDVQYHLISSPKTRFVISTSIASYKNPRELKIESAYADQGGKSYIFDKKNYAYVLSPTFGISKSWVERDDFSRMSVRTTFAAGPALALLKPYYLEVAVPISNNQAYVETEAYNASQHNYTNIVGEADFFLGMNEMRVQPGIKARVSTIFDFSGGGEYIRGVELSAYADYFVQPLDLMDLTQDRRFWLGGSIELLIGNTW